MTATDMRAQRAASGPMVTRDQPVGQPLLGDPCALRWAWEGRYVRLLVVVDVAATLLATPVAGVLHPAVPYAWWYLSLPVLMPVTWLAVLTLSRAYDRRLLFEGGEEHQRILGAGVRLTVAMTLTSYVLHAGPARDYLLIALTLTVALSLAGRLALRRRLHRARRRGAYLRRVLILGHVDAVRDVTRLLRRHPHHGLHVIGVCLPPAQLPAAAGLDVAVFGALNTAANAAAAVGADTVVVLSCPELDGGMLRRLAWELERDDIDLFVSSALRETVGDRITVRPVSGLPMMHVAHPRLAGPGQAAKALFDALLAGVLLVLLAPLFLIIALAIRLHSPGPVFFRQLRVGRNGETFRMVKFRTMDADAEQRLESLRGQNEFAGALFKIRRDPRVTRLGRILRRFSLDELPQLVNVLHGDMSLVGPRPPLPSEVDRYPREMRRRLVVKPGMTGLWQVSGRSDLSWEEAIRLDLQYVDNWTFTQDLAILLRTAVVVVRGSGAY